MRDSTSWFLLLIDTKQHHIRGRKRREKTSHPNLLSDTLQHNELWWKTSQTLGKQESLEIWSPWRGSGVINYNPCDHWMSPLFLECSNSKKSRAPGKECARTHGHRDRMMIPTDSSWIPTEIPIPIPNALSGSRAGTREQQGTLRNTLWIQLPPGSLSVCLMVNNAAPSGAGWQILRGSQKAELFLRRCEGSLD